MGKEKNSINVLTDFSIFHKSGIKIFLTYIVKYDFKDALQHDMHDTRKES